MVTEPVGRKSIPSYFLVAVSTRENLEICIKYALAGFLSGENGVWTFSEIEDGDLVSFLYGARAHNLYRVAKKECVIADVHLPPWQPLRFKAGGMAYSFPFRLRLTPVRTFVEPIVRTEFFYVAENLLLRGGYRKTHFQADQTTLQSVSQMGVPKKESPIELVLPNHRAFTPRFTQNASLVNKPEIFRFQEMLLQSAIRQHLRLESNLNALLASLEINDIAATALEILGEKALTKGHIDLLIKERAPLGTLFNLPVEVKTKAGQPKDVLQIRDYVDELRGECRMGILIASGFGAKTRSTAATHNVALVRYIVNCDLQKPCTFEEIHRSLELQVARE